MKNNIQKSIILGQLIGKYLTHSESAKEKEALDDWLNEIAENKELLHSIHSDKNLAQEYETMGLFNKDQALNRFKDRIVLKSKTRALVRWKMAASILVLVGISSVLYFMPPNFFKTPPDFSTQHEETIRYTSFSTENGQSAKVVLPDSSIVWLNSGTTLSYPGGFSGQNRKVILSGQAFFQVTRHNDYPFLVHANDLIVTVRGTKFDVYAYPEEDETAIALESGKVELTHQKISSFSYAMNPGEKATLDLTDNTMNIDLIDVAVYSSWKDGKLIFRNSTMENVVEKLKRWYDVDIEIVDSEVYNSIFTGTIRNESYEEIFRLIGIACHVNCKIVHNYEQEAKPHIIISKKQ